MGAYERGDCSASTPFLRSDADASGVLDVSDPVYNLVYQFFGDVAPLCLDALDDDDSGEINLTDPIFSLAFQFLGGKPMPPPGHLSCGRDETEDKLGCDSHASCEE